MSDKEFQQEVIDRLARIETTLNETYKQRFETIEDKIENIEGEKKWIWRSLVGAVILFLVDLFKNSLVLK